MTSASTTNSRQQFSQAEATRPFAITFTDGHYAVWQCKNKGHAYERAAQTYPQRTVKSVEPVK